MYNICIYVYITICEVVTAQVFGSCQPCHGLTLGLSKFHTLQMSARVHGPWQTIDLDWNMV